MKGEGSSKTFYEVLDVKRYGGREVNFEAADNDSLCKFIQLSTTLF